MPLGDLRDGDAEIGVLGIRLSAALLGERKVIQELSHYLVVRLCAPRGQVALHLGLPAGDLSRQLLQERIMWLRRALRLLPCLLHG